MAMRERIHRAVRILNTLFSHGIWVMGLALIADAIYTLQWTTMLHKHPQVAVFWIGVFIFVAGREAVNYRKKLYREQRKVEHLEERVEYLEGLGDWQRKFDE